MRKKVFIFHIGDKQKIAHLNLSRFKNIDFEIGPSKGDHELLMTKSDFYKKSYNLKKYAFCSDVGRFYILSREQGLYIDTSVDLGEDFEEFVFSLERDVVLFRERGNVIASAVAYSGKKDNAFFKNVYQTYLEDNINPLTMLISPYNLTYYVGKKKKDYFGYGDISFENIEIRTLKEIRNLKTICKRGSSSWGATVNLNPDSGATTERMGDLKKIPKRDLRAVKRTIEFGPETDDVFMIRTFFDSPITSDEQRKELGERYRKLPYRPKMDEGLIGSKLYIFFNKFKRNK